MKIKIISNTVSIIRNTESKTPFIDQSATSVDSGTEKTRTTRTHIKSPLPLSRVKCSRARCRKRARGEGAALGSPPIPAERVYEPTRHCQGYLSAPFPFCAAAAGVQYRLRWRLYPRRQRCPHNFDWSLFSSLFFKLYGHSSPWFFLGCRPTYGYLFQAREDGKRLCWI